MVAIASEVEIPTDWPAGPFDAKGTRSALAVWGNWYLRRTAHEFGWSSHYACLSYFGLFVAGHKVLFDTPAHVRFIDVAVGQTPEPIRWALALEYWWHRELKTGRMISTREKAEALGLDTPSAFNEVVRTGRWLAQLNLNALDLRRDSVRLAQVAELSSATA